MKPERLGQARWLRAHMTYEEKLLWMHLQGQRQIGARFRRQAIILGWIVDFYCPKAKLVVEVDGPGHNAKKDEHRDTSMRYHGFRVLRVTNETVRENLGSVLAMIRWAITDPRVSVEAARPADPEKRDASS